jgi:hypothetical protein
VTVARNEMPDVASCCICTLTLLQACCAEKAAVVQHKATRNAALADILTALKQRRLHAESLEHSSSSSSFGRSNSTSSSSGGGSSSSSGQQKKKQQQQQQQQLTRQLSGVPQAASDVATDVSSDVAKRWWVLQERAAAAAVPVQRGGSAGAVGFAESNNVAVLRGAEIEDLDADILDEPKVMSVKLKVRLLLAKLQLLLPMAL